MLIHNALLASPPLQYIVLLHQMLEKFDNRKQSRSVKWITFIFWNRNRKWKWKTWCSPAHPSISLCVRHVKSHRKNRIQNDVVNCCRHCCFNMEIFRGFVICSIDGSLEAEEQNRLFGLINQSLDQFAESCTICAENHDLFLWKYDFTQNLSSFTTILLYFVSSSTKIYGIVYKRKNIWVFYIFLFSVVRFVVFFVFFSFFFVNFWHLSNRQRTHHNMHIEHFFFGISNKNIGNVVSSVSLTTCRRHLFNNRNRFCMKLEYLCVVWHLYLALQHIDCGATFKTKKKLETKIRCECCSRYTNKYMCHVVFMLFSWGGKNHFFSTLL